MKTRELQIEYILNNSNITANDLKHYAAWTLYDDSPEGYLDFGSPLDYLSPEETEAAWNALQVIGDYRLEVVL